MHWVPSDLPSAMDCHLTQSVSGTKKCPVRGSVIKKKKGKKRTGSGPGWAWDSDLDLGSESDSDLVGTTTLKLE